MSEVDGFDLLWTCTLTLSNVLFDVFVICYHTSHLVLYTSLHPSDRVFLTHLAPSNFLVLQILSFYRYCTILYNIVQWSQYDGKLWNMNVNVMVSGMKVLHYMGQSSLRHCNALMIYKRSRLEGRGVVGFRRNLCRVSSSGESSKTLALTGWRLWQQDCAACKKKGLCRMQKKGLCIM